MRLVEMNLVVDAKIKYWTGLSAGRVAINPAEVAAIFEADQGTNILLRTPVADVGISGDGELRRLIVKESYLQVVAALQRADN
jgi:hypothetical protein